MAYTRDDLKIEVSKLNSGKKAEECSDEDLAAYIILTGVERLLSRDNSVYINRINALTKEVEKRLKKCMKLISLD